MPPGSNLLGFTAEHGRRRVPMQQNAVSQATHGVAAAMREVADAVYQLQPAAPDAIGGRAELRSPFEGVPGLELALRLCRYQDEEGVWHGLAERVKRIPAEHVAKACTVGHGPECWVVHCLCGAVEFVASAMVECRGGCGRWLVADSVAVWSVRLPKQEADDA